MSYTFGKFKDQCLTTRILFFFFCDHKITGIVHGSFNEENQLADDVQHGHGSDIVVYLSFVFINKKSSDDGENDPFIHYIFDRDF